MVSKRAVASSVIRVLLPAGASPLRGVGVKPPLGFGVKPQHIMLLHGIRKNAVLNLSPTLVFSAVR